MPHHTRTAFREAHVLGSRSWVDVLRHHRRLERNEALERASDDDGGGSLFGNDKRPSDHPRNDRKFPSERLGRRNRSRSCIHGNSAGSMLGERPPRLEQRLWRRRFAIQQLADQEHVCDLRRRVNSAATSVAILDRRRRQQEQRNTNPQPLPRRVHRRHRSTFGMYKFVPSNRNPLSYERWMKFAWRTWMWAPHLWYSERRLGPRLSRYFFAAPVDRLGRYL